jgi:type II secretory pathway pseudopilin PulG
MKKHRASHDGPNRSNTAGFTYMALLAFLVIIGITLGTVARYWSNIAAREKEEELLFRGDQYRHAIENYYYGMPGRYQYPASIDELVKDSRSAAGKRYLRQKFKDPITGKDFVEIKNQNMRVIGVCSASEKEPIKQANFDPDYADFEGKTKYNDWKFQFIAPVIQTPEGLEGSGGPIRRRLRPNTPTGAGGVTSQGSGSP